MKSNDIQKIADLQSALIDLLVYKGLVSKQELAATLERAFPGDPDTAADAAYRQSALFALLERNGIIKKDELLQRAQGDQQTSD